MGFRSMPYVEAEGVPQFAGMGIASGGGGGGGGGESSINVVADETEIGTILGKKLYRRVVSVSAMKSTWDPIGLNGNYYPLMGMYFSEYYSNYWGIPCCMVREYSSGNLKAKIPTSESFGDFSGGKILFWYTKEPI